MAAEALLLTHPPTSTLLCFNLPDPLLAALRSRKYCVKVNSISGLAGVPTPSELTRADVALLDVTTGGRDMIQAAWRLRSVIGISSSVCPLLCFSTAHRSPRFVMELTQRGARYVRIGDPLMLIEAIELLVAEVAQFERAGPCFRIRHRFSRGSCAPGEEIAAIELAHNGCFFQLRLALSGRFMFNCLAENQSLALDALQIAASLNSWFYREHGLNGGLRQTTKVRVATIKVLVQRIRKAMSSAFASARLTCDPYEVLRSFPAEGSTRALYRLHADVQWEHLPQ